MAKGNNMKGKWFAMGTQIIFITHCQLVYYPRPIYMIFRFIMILTQSKDTAFIFHDEVLYNFDFSCVVFMPKRNFTFNFIWC